MTAQEFIAHLAPVELTRLALIFDWLGDHSDELRTHDGQRLNDATDWSAFLHEAAAAARMPIPFPRDRTCPDCEHEHEGKAECGHYLGEGKFCQCESKVTA